MCRRLICSAAPSYPARCWPRSTCSITLGRCWLNPSLGPILPKEDQPANLKQLPPRSRFDLYRRSCDLSCLWPGPGRCIWVHPLWGSAGAHRDFADQLPRLHEFEHVLRIVAPIAIAIQAVYAISQIMALGGIEFALFYHAAWLIFLGFGAYKSIGLYAAERR